MRVCAPFISEVLPTAQISSAETAAAAVNTLDTEGTWGLATIVHCLPFQCSSCVCAGPTVRLDRSPTAHTSVPDRAATATSLVTPAPVPGLLAMFHWPQLAARAALAPVVRSNKRASMPMKMPWKRCLLSISLILFMYFPPFVVMDGRSTEETSESLLSFGVPRVLTLWPRTSPCFSMLPSPPSSILGDNTGKEDHH